MVSVIIVNYHVEKQLLNSLKSVYAAKNKSKFEIIIVDNNENDDFKKILKKKFPKVIYIKSLSNIGFGAANNIGAEEAKGEYLFFLNPDTLMRAHSLDSLLDLLIQEKDAGIVAPLLLGKNGKPYQQGSQELTPRSGIFALSFLNKLFPTNPVSKKYFLQEWDRKSVKEVSVVPGTAFMIKKKLFTQIGGFDKQFFLFFEEFDLSYRVRKLGYKLFITPKAKVVHAWGESTKQRKDIAYIFAASRFAYFKKHFGLFKASLVELFLQINKTTVALIGLLLLTFFLSTYRLSEFMPFIGDQGWYYLSARDLAYYGIFPLVGIESSRPWLHQGAYWTYILAASFKIFGYNPVVGVYSTIFFQLASLLLLYKVGLEMFNRKVGIIAALFFAVSPLALFFVRQPYHTSPIVFFVLLLLFLLYRWTKGFILGFPLIILILGILYNLELATFPLSICIALFLLLGLIYKKLWAREVFHLRIFALSFIAFIASMFPMLAYDISHGYPQTLKFLAWGGYKLLVFLGYPPINPQSTTTYIEMLEFAQKSYAQLMLPVQPLLASICFILSMTYLTFRAFADWKQSKITSSYILLFVPLFICLGAFFAMKTTSDAYLPMLIPFLILALAVFLVRLLKVATFKWFVLACIVFIINTTIWYLFVHEFHKAQHPISLEERISAARYIIEHAKGKPYSLHGKGPGSQFKSYTMNYEYIAWYLGHEPSDKKEKLQFTIQESSKGIIVTYD